MALIFHPFANRFPLLQGDELKKLADDIRKNGQVFPVVVDQGGTGIDGRNRAAACALIGIEPKIEAKVFASDTEIIRYIWSANAERRHLTASQKAAFALTMMEAFEEDAKKRQVEGGGDKKSENAKKSVREKIPEAIFEEKEDVLRPRDEVAALTGVNERYIQDAKLLRDSAPDLLKEVQEGGLTLPRAKERLEARKEAIASLSEEKVKALPPEKQRAVTAAREEKQGKAGKDAANKALAALADEKVVKEAEAKTLATKERQSVLKAARKIKKESGPHVAQNTGENEWYTPNRIMEAAREVMGEIDLDPASCEAANGIVKADKFFTEADDGLAQDWFGRVWLNPPYSADKIGPFVDKLCREADHDSIREAICLVNNATETQWGQKLLHKSRAVCFLAGRVKFIDKAGNPSGAPLQGQALYYFGAKPHDFRDIFRAYGVVLCKM